MKYCKKCVMPDTRPHSIFDEQGVCQACRNYDKQKIVDWSERDMELTALCEKYKRGDGYYDCIIAVSGGKDSHFLTYLMKEELGMNPLLICVGDPFTTTATGAHNLRNLGESFGCDIMVFNISTELVRRVTKIGFEVLGEPLRFIETAIYTVPFKYAVHFNIPLVIFGENAAYTYGTTSEDSFSAEKYILAGHSAAAEKLGDTITDFWQKRGIPSKEMNAISLPPEEAIRKVKPVPIFLSYFVPWDDEKNYNIAKRYGFKDLHHEWRREGYLEDYGQIDSIAYLVHLWMKYPKFGFARATDIASRWVRKGRISRDEARRLVMENDRRLDQRAMEDFITFLGYTRRKFFDIIEGFWNPELFEKIDGAWELKEPVYKDIREGGF